MQPVYIFFHLNYQQCHGSEVIWLFETVEPLWISFLLSLSLPHQLISPRRTKGLSEAMKHIFTSFWRRDKKKSKYSIEHVNTEQNAHSQTLNLYRDLGIWKVILWSGLELVSLAQSKQYRKIILVFKSMESLTFPPSPFVLLLCLFSVRQVVTNSWVKGRYFTFLIPHSSSRIYSMNLLNKNKYKIAVMKGLVASYSSLRELGQF